MNLDQILLQRQIAMDENARQSRCRLDELKDQEQRTMWDFIRKCIRGRNKRTRNQTEREIDLERKTNAVKRRS